ncbi:MAG: hypothetical protein K2X32_01355 [Phycisphaerales bacterium]|nr:hypothetical protein [Phycisphaerales bacterium]
MNTKTADFDGLFPCVKRHPSRRRRSRSSALAIAAAALSIGSLAIVGGCAPNRSYVNNGAYADEGHPVLMATTAGEFVGSAPSRVRFPAVVAVACVTRAYDGSLRLAPAGMMSSFDVTPIGDNEQIRKVAPITLLDTEHAAGSTVSQLRRAALRLNADMLLIYEVRTSRTPTGTVPLIGLASLGVVPDSSAAYTASAVALLVDVRTSYQFATLNAQAEGSRISNMWGRSSAAYAAEMDALRATNEKLLVNFASAWKEIVATHGKAAGATPALITPALQPRPPRPLIAQEAR